VAFVRATAARRLQEDAGGTLHLVAGPLLQLQTASRVHFVDAIPKTASGKILRRELRKSMN